MFEEDYLNIISENARWRDNSRTLHERQLCLFNVWQKGKLHTGVPNCRLLRNFHTRTVTAVDPVLAPAVPVSIANAVLEHPQITTEPATCN